MQIRAIAADITEVEADAVVVNLFEETDKPGGATAAVDARLDGAISSMVSGQEVKGKYGEVTVIHTFGKLPARMVAIAGLGQREQFDLDRVRGVAGEACRTLRKMNCRRVATVLHGAGAGGIDATDSARAVVEGSLLGLYEFTLYKKSEYSEIEDLVLVERAEDRMPAVEQAVNRARVVADSTVLARDMVNEPANAMTPSRMAEIATDIGRKHGLEVNVMRPDEMERMGMGALLAVARGSVEQPRFIVMRYRGDAGSNSTAGFLGKGVTFDSGGISIKPSEGLGEMKDDMAGGAAVIAALGAIARLEEKVNVTGIVPATENLPSGSALKPGDIVRALNGKTIEIVSTDAEGRLILADALSYAGNEGLSPLVDLATLTGACRVALGTLYSGIFGNDREFVDRIVSASGYAGEKLWPMPLPEEYREMNKSQIADVKNTGNRYAGAITAALFLSEFVDKRPWAHIDIAGTASSSKETGYTVKGATGVGVRTLVEFAGRLAG
ncbi:MAG: leucyl aminopeptidase [Chloroflexota bacterium]